MTRWLIDTSALVRFSVPEVDLRLGPLVDAGLVSTCTAIDLEVGRSARSGLEHAAGRRDRAALFDTVPTGQAELDRAHEVQGLLADRGHHRGVPLADLIVAATAERAGLTVLHYDADYDRIAAVTGQPVEWVVERGSID